MFLYSRCAFDVVDGVFLISDVLSTLSTGHSSFRTCFRRCRRGILHFGRAFDVVDEAFSHFRRVIRSLFQVSLFFGYGFVDYSGLFGVFPSLFSAPAWILQGRSGWRIFILEIDKGAHAVRICCFGGREIQIVLPVTHWGIVSHVVGSVL